MRRLAALAFAWVAVWASQARALEYVAGITPYCRAFSPPGGDQELSLTAPIPAGHSVHINVVTSANVTLTSVTDVGGNSYSPIVSGTAGAFSATLLAAPIVNGLPAGESIHVAIAATGSGSSCVASFETDAPVEVDRSGSAVGSGLIPLLDLDPLGAGGELVHALLFGGPTTLSIPVVTRDPPLVAVTSGCVGTSSGQMCAFPSYAEVVAAGPLSLSHSLTHPLSWGVLAATYVPEPSASAVSVAALLALVGCRRASARRHRGLP